MIMKNKISKTKDMDQIMIKILKTKTKTSNNKNSYKKISKAKQIKNDTLFHLLFAKILILFLYN